MGESGLDLVANSLVASVPAMAGILLLGLIGRAVAIIAALLLVFRLVGLWRHGRGGLHGALPASFTRAMWIFGGAEMGMATVAMATLVLPLGLASPRATIVAVFGAWGLIAGVGIAAIAFGCRRIARSVDSGWAAATATLAVAASLLAGVASMALAGMNLWFMVGNAGPSSAEAIAWLAVMAIAIAGSLSSVLLTRVLLLSIEAHAIGTTIDAMRVRTDPLRELGVPHAPPTSPASQTTLPLEPARPPVRSDL